MSEPNTRACDFCDGTGKFYSREAIAAEGGDDPDCSVCNGTGRLPSPMPEPSTPFDAGELLRWAESYGHPEEWAKKNQQLHATNERLLAFIVDLSEGWVGNVQERATRVRRGGR